MQRLGWIFISSVLTVSLNSNVSHATPLAAGFAKIREPQSFVQTPVFTIQVAPIPTDRARSLPEPVIVDVPTAARTYEAKDWYGLMTTRGNECFIPELSLLNVISVTKTRVLGIVQWYSTEPQDLSPQCAGRAPPQKNGLCLDGSMPKTPACSNGASVLMEFNDVVDVATNTPVDPSYFTERINKAVRAGR